MRRLGDESGFPWLTASRLPDLVLYHPVGLDDRAGEPTSDSRPHAGGSHVELGSEELEAELAERFGSGWN